MECVCVCMATTRGTFGFMWWRPSRPHPGRLKVDREISWSQRCVQVLVFVPAGTNSSCSCSIDPMRLQEYDDVPAPAASKKKNLQMQSRATG